MKEQIQVQTICHVHKGCILCSIKVEAFIIFKTEKMLRFGSKQGKTKKLLNA